MLHKFEGKEVIGTKVAIRRAGDGLSKALAIDPLELTIGTRVFVVMECEVGTVGFRPVKDTQSLTREQDLIALTVTVVDKALVAEVLAATQAKIDEAEGKKHLAFPDGDEEGSDGGQ